MIDFRVLGPVTVQIGNASPPVAIPAATLRRLLAALLCHHGRAVAVPDLVEALWPGTSPANPRKALQVYVHRLRRMLADDLRIPHTADGYALLTEADEVDASRFLRLADRARTLRRQGDPAGASEAYTTALGLWRGPAYADVAMGGAVAEEAARLEERRLTAIEDRISADLDLRRHAQLIPELTALTGAHPFRERLCALLLLALYRADRQAEALALFRKIRRVLAEQLGTEPGPPLQRLHEAVLRGDERLSRLDVATLDRLAATPQSLSGPPAVPSLVPPPHAVHSAMPVPRQLPADGSGFTGRRRELDLLDTLAGGPEQPGLVVIAGSAGVGKTAFAVHWAHRVADRFTDGQLYLNLRGYANTRPMRPVEALAQFLRTLGATSEQMPIDLAEATAFYRSLLAGRRMLILLDNAASVDQIRPLLPGAPGCLVVVTSRDRLAGLVAREGAQRLTLDVLDRADALALLAAQLGADRVGAEATAARELAQLCAHLPLALRVAAANLTDRPHRTLAAQVAELRREDRLDILAVDGDEETTVRAAFDLSYRSVPEPAARQFRMLGLFPGPELTAQAAAALAGVDAVEAAALLDRLARAHLVDQPGAGRYALHDLLRLYAAQQACRYDTEPERAAARDRLHRWYLGRIDAVARLLYPQFVRIPAPCGATNARPAERPFADEAAAMQWLDAELANLVAVIRDAADHGATQAAWRLADGLRGYFWTRRHGAEWLAVGEAAVTAAESVDDPQGLAAGHLSLALAYRSLTRYAEAIPHLYACLAASRRASWREAESSALGSLAVVHAILGQPQLAFERLNESLELNRLMGRRASEAVVLGNLSNLRVHLGQLERAISDASAALALYREANSLGGEGLSLTVLGTAHLFLGRPTEALGHLTRSLERFERIGDRYGQALSHLGLARCHRYAGRYGQAHTYGETALALTRETGDRHTEAGTLVQLGAIRRDEGDVAAALSLGTEALRVARGTASPHAEVEALVELAETYRRAGRAEGARSLANEALVLAGERGYRLLEGEAMTTLAALQLAAAESAGMASLDIALAIHREIGNRPGERRALAMFAPAPVP